MNQGGRETEPLGEQDARQLFESIYERLNEHDLDHIEDIWTEDVEFRDDAWPTTMRSQQDVRDFFSALWTAAPDLRFELLEGPYMSSDGRHAALRARVGGTYTGSYDPPGIGPTNSLVTTEFGAFFELEDGRIRRERVILNMYEAAVQQGALPERGSLGERITVRFQRLNAWRLRRR